MRNVIKLSLSIGVLVALYLKWETWLSRVTPNSLTIINVSLLMSYGMIIGFSLFVVFIMMLQHMGLERIKFHRPKLTKVLFAAYVVLSIALIITCVFYFTIEKTIVLAILFMLVTAIFDMLKEKILIECEGNVIHPKRII